jgi:hypothetical protein
VQKISVLNVFTEGSQDNPHNTLDEGAGLVAYASGIAKSSMYCSRKEMEGDGKLVPSNKTSKAKQQSEEYDSFMKTFIHERSA